MKRPGIILTADDFAANDFIDNGIIKAVEAGKINCVSAFVTHPSSLDRISDLRNRFPHLAIGLHFSVTSGSPLNHTSSILTEELNGEHHFQQIYNYSYKPVEDKALAIEAALFRQIEAISSVVGGIDEIDHVVTHHNLTFFESAYFRRLAKVLGKRGIPTRSLNAWSIDTYLRDRNASRFGIAPVLLEGLRLKLFNLDMLSMGKRKRIAKNNNLLYPDLLCDVIYGQPSSEHYRFLIKHFQERKGSRFSDINVEFMFHLGDRTSISPDQMSDARNTHGIDPRYFAMRQRELSSLLQIDLDSLMEKYRFGLTTFRQAFL